MTEIAAYRERPSVVAEGVLRDEWRVVPFRENDPEQDARLAEAFGPDWRRYRPFPKAVLEHRYIRRGVEEPWLPVALGNSPEGALGEVDPGAVAVDPRLAAIQQKRADYAAERDRKASEEREREAAARERRRRSADSQAAFRRLAASGDAEWAERWNAAVSSRSTEQRDQLRKDPEFVRLHEAVMAAVTVPSKRKAIRAALAYLGQGRLAP